MHDGMPYGRIQGQGQVIFVLESRDSELDQNLSGDLRKIFLPISMKFGM